MRIARELSRSSCSARGHDDVALQHDTRCAKDLRLLPSAGRGLRFDQRVEVLLDGAPDMALIVRTLLVTWRQLREQIALFDKAVQQQVRMDPRTSPRPVAPNS